MNTKNNCHNCRHMTGETRVQYRCSSPNSRIPWVNENILGEECGGWKEAEKKEAVDVKCNSDLCDNKGTDLCKTCGPANLRHWYKEKEAVQVEHEKEYTTGQMIDMLLDNPKRKAVLIGERGECGQAYFQNGNLHWDGRIYTVNDDEKDNQWRIIEPEPPKWKPKSGEAYCYPDITRPCFYNECNWQDDTWDAYRYNHDFVCKTPDEAIAEAKRILKLREDADK